MALLYRMAELFKVLGDETRLKIIKLLASNTVDSLCVTDLAKQNGISQQAASQHIMMKMAGILEPNKVGQHVYYKINLSNFRTMKQDMDQLFEMAFVQCRDCEHYPNCTDCVK